ncbi:MFS transporter [Deinococcus cellulosilyticus]|uniref:MFS transporter n=1 Tax=Deinococcus cellulosilyticus (strain DSM 18568 / NBRC 106333 / KACC 11606 / 5516J-15) TaxID=1223518 RepID=A0A511N1J5_DEIC1|nr:MFS transporter [Deinococcus cellulosilyticus]GEM46743.1 MFS transporter [Deinococcus cellulosilyticus NBRC 106333 = KACC 11606]
MQSLYADIRDPKKLTTLKLSVWEGCIWQIYATWLLGPIFIGYLGHLGASSTELAFAGSIPFLAQLSGPITAWWVSQVKKRKRLMFYLGMASRLLGLLPLTLLFIDLPTSEKVVWLLVGLTFTNIFQSAAGTIWSGIMGDVVPSVIRGRYFGMRNGLMGICATAASLAGGLVIDHLVSPTNYALLFGAAFVLSIISTLMYLMYHDPYPSAPKLTFKDVLMTPLRDPKFAPFLRFMTVWGGAQAFCTVMLIPYFLNVLDFTMTQVGLYAALTAAIGLLVNYQIGSIVDRIPNTLVLKVAALSSALLIPITLLVIHQTHWTFLVWFLAVLEAIIYNAANLAIFNLAMHKTQPGNRLPYLSSGNLLSGAAAFVMGLVSGWVVSILQGQQVAGAYVVYFLLCIVMRLVCLIPIRGVRIADAASGD